MNLGIDQSHAESSKNGVFATTHWTVVLQAGGREPSAATAALEQLCRTYWFPLYAFIRRKGHDTEEAKDLTQGFFARLLERRDFQEVNPAKGKFRTFLLASLTHYLSNERDRAIAVKRGGGQTIFSLDAIPPEQFQRFEPATNMSPDKLFDQRWAMALLESAVVQLQAEMEAAGKGAQFAEVKSFLTNEPSDGDYSAVGQRFGCPRQSVAVMVHRLRRRYRELVRAEVANTVSSPMEVDDEIRYLRTVITI